MTDECKTQGDVRLREEEVERHVCCVKPRLCRDEHFHERDVERIVAARVGEVVERVEAVLGDWCDHDAPGDCGCATCEMADDVRAALRAADAPLSDDGTQESPEAVRTALGGAERATER